MNYKSIYIIFFCLLSVLTGYSQVKNKTAIYPKTELFTYPLPLNQPQKTIRVLKKNPDFIRIKLINLKSRDHVYENGTRYNTQQTELITTFKDSIEGIKELVYNISPINKFTKLMIAKNEIIHFRIDVTTNSYDYFLKRGDNLSIEFDYSGKVSKSYLNGDENNPALIFAKNLIPNRKFEYVKYIKRAGFNSGNGSFSSSFYGKYYNSVEKVNRKINQFKGKIPNNLHTTLSKHLEFSKILSQYAQGTSAYIPLSDSYLNLPAYRKLSQYMLQNIKLVGFLNSDREGLDNAYAALSQLKIDGSFFDKPKTRNLIISELITTVGDYESNYAPDLINSISDIETRDRYLNFYDEKYGLYSQAKRKESHSLNIASIKRGSKIIRFQDLLDKHRGKVIYVNFSSMPCYTCQSMMTNVSSLKYSLANDRIVFINLSTDASFTNWKLYNIDREMHRDPNNFIILNKNSSTRYKSWFISENIPHALIFDKNGMLVNKSAPLASDISLKDLLLQYAYKD